MPTLSALSFSSRILNSDGTRFWAAMYGAAGLWFIPEQV
jgi:hypothetical protein